MSSTIASSILRKFSACAPRSTRTGWRRSWSRPRRCARRPRRLLADFLGRGKRVLDHVVQQPGGNADRVEFHVGRMSATSSGCTSTARRNGGSVPYAPGPSSRRGNSRSASGCSRGLCRAGLRTDHWSLANCIGFRAKFRNPVSKVLGAIPHPRRGACPPVVRPGEIVTADEGGYAPKTRIYFPACLSRRRGSWRRRPRLLNRFYTGDFDGEAVFGSVSGAVYRSERRAGRLRIHESGPGHEGVQGRQ